MRTSQPRSESVDVMFDLNGSSKEITCADIKHSKHGSEQNVPLITLADGIGRLDV